MAKKFTGYKSASEILEKLQKQAKTPYDERVEQSVLGSMIVDKTACMLAMGVIGIRTDETAPFYTDRHKITFQAICNITSENEAVDLISLTREIQKKHGELEQIGGAAYLVELTSKVVTTANIESHCRLLLELHVARELILYSAEIQARSYLQEDDPLELLATAQQRLFDISTQTHRKNIPSIKSITEETLHQIENRADREITGLSSGLADLDSVLCGFQKQNLIVLAARPSQGKTAQALHYAKVAAVEGGKVTMIFSLEMGACQLVQRLLCSIAEVDSNYGIRKGTLSTETKIKLNRAGQILGASPLFIDDTSNITPLEIRSKCMQVKFKHGLDLVIIDYLQLMELGIKIERERQIATISRALKGLAKELDVPVIVLSQLNRNVESRADKRPMLSDLRESGAIEQDADVVILIYRPEHYGIDTFEGGASTENVTVDIIAKHRDGPTDEVKVLFIKESGVYKDLINMPIFEKTF